MATRNPAPDTAPLAFTPVPAAARRNGWTAERQRAFIQALATTGGVTEAAAAVGMHARSAYPLRQRPDGEAFDRAWDIALRLGARRLLESAIERAMHGTLRHVRLGDTIVQERIPDTRLTIYLLDPVNGAGGPFACARPETRHRTSAALLADLGRITDSDAPLSGAKFAKFGLRRRTATPLPGPCLTRRHAGTPVMSPRSLPDQFPAGSIRSADATWSRNHA